MTQVGFDPTSSELKARRASVAPLRRSGRQRCRTPTAEPCHCFRNRVPPANEAYLPGAEGQRIERWRGCPRPSLSKRAPFLSVNPPLQQIGSVTVLPIAPPARFERAPSGVGDRCASNRNTGAVGPKEVQSHHPEPTRGPQPYRGCALRTELWRRGLVDWTRTSGLRLRTAALLSV